MAFQLLCRPFQHEEALSKPSMMTAVGSLPGRTSNKKGLCVVQQRIAAGVRQMLELWFQHKPFPEDFYIVREGKLAEQYT